MSHDGQGQDQFDAFTGDHVAAAQLRTNLERVAKEHVGTAIGRVAEDVLNGQRPVRDLGTDPGFSSLIEEGIDAYRQYRGSLTPDERALLASQAVNRGPGRGTTV